jgi:signal transduction histidine kinase
MAPALALSGWLTALLACLSFLAARRALGCRVEAIARACHELRGPLTAARLGLELGVRRGALSPDRLRALDLELGRAALAIDDLALLAGPPPTGSTHRWEEVEVYGLIADSVEAWRPFAQARGVDVALRSAGGPAVVLADRLRLAQASGNLIANAIEHGGGQLDVRVEPADGTVRIEFVDNGPGLPAPVAELARRGRHRRGPRGHGVAVAAAVAASHGGRLAGAPSEGGARVVLELPRAAGGARVAGGGARVAGGGARVAGGGAPVPSQVSAPDSSSQPGGGELHV